MKKLFVAFIILAAQDCFAQTLVIKGRVRCMNENVNSTKGAENVIVVPTFIPVKSTITASQPPGYFEINTALPFDKLQDKQVHLYIVSKCSNCKDIVKRVFISEDQDRQNTDSKKKYVTVKDWRFNANCRDAELPAFRADSLLSVIIKQPAENLQTISSATALVGSPPLLNLLTTLTVAAPPVAVGVFTADTLFRGKISYGRFLFTSALNITSNTGFNFSPSRNLSEAIFWNPSAIGNSIQPHNISLFTNFRNNIRAGGYSRITDNIWLAAGIIYTRQSESREVKFLNTPVPDPISHQQQLDEYAVFLSPVFTINKQLRAAVTGKFIHQSFNIPDVLDNTFDAAGNKKNLFFDSSVKRQKFDADISFTYKINNALQVGVNVMNVAGTELYADAFTKKQKTIAFQKQRSAGVGLCYKWQRFNVGSDVLFIEDGYYDATLGVNYVPFNNALISAGFAFKQLSYSIAFKLKYFRITYADDNGLTAYEKRAAKINFFNGKLYTGAVINF